MSSPVKSFARAAHLKAAGTILVGMTMALVASLLVSAFGTTGEASGRRSGAGVGKPNGAAREPASTLAAAAPDADTSPDAIPVHILAPSLTSPPTEPQATLPTPPASDTSPARHAEDAPLRNTHEINVAADPSKPEPTPQEIPPGRSATTKTNGQLAISVKYEYAAVENSLRMGRGELVALCRWPGASPTLVLVQKAPNGTYQLRKTAPSDRLANLGLRLSTADGDLGDVERLIRAKTGVEDIALYFAPAADLARCIISSQQTAIEDFHRTQKPTTGDESLLLTARFVTTQTGTPTYEVTGVSTFNAPPDGRASIGQSNSP